MLKVRLLSESAKLPSRGSENAAGFDLYSAVNCTVESRGKALIATDISVAVPIGTYGRIAPRSGLAWKKHVDIGAGVIDPDYRGPIFVLIFNHSDNSLDIKKGDRIAQLILEKYLSTSVVQEEYLDETERDWGGFGSTGV